jgi:hypothetical protein
LGALYRPRPDLDLSVGNYSIYANAARSTNYIAGRWHPKGYPQLFLATTGSSDDGTGNSQRAIILAAKNDVGRLAVDAEYRFTYESLSGEEPDVLGNAGLVRARWLQWKRLQPAALVEAGSSSKDSSSCEDEPGGCVVAQHRLLALGVESSLRNANLFLYGSIGEARDAALSDEATLVRGAFGGIAYTTPRLLGNVRLDLTDDSLLGTQLSAAGRGRWVVTEWLMGFASLSYRSGNRSTPQAQWNHVVGLALRPLVDSRLALFLKYKDRTVPSADPELPSLRARLASADLVMPLARRLSLGTRGAWKWVQAPTAEVGLSVAAQELTWRFAGRWDLITGLRVAGSTTGGELIFGATAGAGVWFDRTLRLVMGLNLAREDWAFEADDSIPGLFVNVTGVYGSAGSVADVY